MLINQHNYNKLITDYYFYILWTVLSIIHILVLCKRRVMWGISEYDVQNLN